DPTPRRLCDETLEFLVEAAAIVEIGERIAHREFLQLCRCPPRRGDVLVDPHPADRATAAVAGGDQRRARGDDAAVAKMKLVGCALAPTRTRDLGDVGHIAFTIDQQRQRAALKGLIPY